MRKIKLPKLNLVAFDPGGTTGVVEVFEGKLYRHCGLDYEEILDRCGGKLISPWVHYDLWVIEDFRLYPWVSEKLAFDPMIPARVIGALEAAAKGAEVTTVFQNAGEVKKFMNNKRLQEFGWFHSLNGDHERDAARHALHYMVFKHGKS